MVLSVELQDNLWVYNPGQTIRGKVVISKNIWNKVEGLSIRFYGRIEVGVGTRTGTASPPPLPSTSNSQQGGSRSRSGGCSGAASRLIGRPQIFEDVLLDHTISLVDNWKVLKPGRHEFEFSYDIPGDLNLPSSMKVNGARIHYEFVTSLKRPRDDYKIYQTPFYICSNAEDYRRPEFEEFLNRTEKNAVKDFACCMGSCCRGGSFGIELKLERRLCSTGERFCFIVIIWNELKINLNTAVVSLVREFKYKKIPGYRTKEIISEVVGPAVLAGESQIWNGSLQIPSTTPSTNVIRRDSYELNYFLKVLVYPMNRISKKLTIKCPVILVPVGTFSAVMMRAAAPEYSPPPPRIEDDCLPPPTYEEATQSIDEGSTSHLLVNQKT